MREKIMPKRIQFQRKRGFKLPENAIRVTHPSRYGNPHKIGDAAPWGKVLDRQGAILLFEIELKDKLASEPDFLEPLRGKDLACFCKEDSPCHGDILLRYANK